MTFKLYKRTPANILYWETWDDGSGTHTVHWGQLGTEGESKTLKDSLLTKASTKIQKEIDGRVAAGYRPIDLDDHRILLVEFSVDGFGDSKDLEKRNRLESRLNETLGWTGLGHVDGGSIGSGTMEVCCYVVDFDLARRVVEADLKGTEFADYSRIYDEGAA